MNWIYKCINNYVQSAESNKLKYNNNEYETEL